MQKLTPEGEQKIEKLVKQYGVSREAVNTLLAALVEGNGTMAQFNHPELGGNGQWMQGGMTMVGDMFNNALKAKVDGLCTALSALLATSLFEASTPPSQSRESTQQTFQNTSNWWPADLGSPSSSGAQNNIRYAIFPQVQRLAMEINGDVTIYDTLDHQIGGVSQQQGGANSVTFTSQKGMVELNQLPIIFGNQVTPPPNSSLVENSSEADILATIEKLADLNKKGILTDDEFTAKKAELLSRL